MQICKNNLQLKQVPPPPTPPPAGAGRGCPTCRAEAQWRRKDGRGVRNDILDIYSGNHSMQSKIKKAMVLAAGYGTRLSPLTDRMPKPLIPVAGKPMIEYALDKLRAYGIEEVIINASHLKDQLTAYRSEEHT